VTQQAASDSCWDIYSYMCGKKWTFICIHSKSALSPILLVGNLIAASISEKYDRIPFATKITTRLTWNVTGSFTRVVIFIEKSYFSEILVRMKLGMYSRPNRADPDPVRSSVRPAISHRPPHPPASGLWPLVSPYQGSHFACLQRTLPKV